MLVRLIAFALLLSLIGCNSQPEIKDIPERKGRIPPPTKS